MRDGGAQGQRQLGSDDLFEDIFGLNVRGLRTAVDTFVRPSQVFAAARQPDWARRYTPSVRLAFSILGLLAFFSFFWAGEESLMTEQIKGVLSEGERAAFQNDADAQEGAMRILGYYAAGMPIGFLIMHGLMSQIVRVWGRGTGGVARLRLYMASVIPNFIATFVVSMLMPIVSMALYQPIAAGLIVLTFVLDGGTALRGGIVADTRLRRILKAVLFALASLVASLVANAACLTSALFLAGIEDGFTQASNLEAHVP